MLIKAYKDVKLYLSYKTKINKYNMTNLSKTPQSSTADILRLKGLINQDRITKKEAADLLSVSETTIENYVLKKLLTKHKLGSSRQSKVFLSKKEVLALIGFKESDNDLHR